MTVILGIDPGSRAMGWGVVFFSGQTLQRAECGVLKVNQKDEMSIRLAFLYDSLCDIVKRYAIEEVAVEEVFVHRNVQSALKLGQARGVALACCGSLSLPVFEYTPRYIKKACVGYGQASKAQVQQMMKQLCRMRELPQSDAADALAVAMCHFQQRSWQGRCKQAMEDK